MSTRPWGYAEDHSATFFAQMHQALRLLYGRANLTQQRQPTDAEDVMAFTNECSAEQLFDFIEAGFTTGRFIGTARGAAPVASFVLALLSAGLLAIREHYSSLLVDVRMQEKPLEALQQKRDELVQQLCECPNAKLRV